MAVNGDNPEAPQLCLGRFTFETSPRLLNKRPNPNKNIGVLSEFDWGQFPTD